ncbi:hypothetical protein scyTo_0015435 [Scyliorhinus torazame]|uniref:Peptidase S1 domain-containing protein n=1 Tax=Scyliorhinus torazame TaxID=75743 RepID=A0A401PSN7_SCYTO|nr:hypothetical protein [Scyliorhinus torazame]
MFSRELNPNLVIIAGTLQLDDVQIIYKVHKIIVHKYFVRDLLGVRIPDHDIALVLVRGPLMFNNLVSPVCLPDDRHFDMETVNNCWVTGWQLKSVARGPMPPIYHMVKEHVRYQTLATCEKFYPENLRKNVICVTNWGKKQSLCMGGYGAPLECQDKRTKIWIIAGAASFCKPSCNYTALFTRISVGQGEEGVRNIKPERGQSFAQGQTSKRNFPDYRMMAQGEEVEPGEDQGEELGPGQSQGEELEPGQAQGEELGPGEAQDEELGPGEAQGEELGSGEAQGEELGSGEAQGEAPGPGEAQGEELGSGDAQGEAPGPGQSQGEELEHRQAQGEELGPGQAQDEELGPGEAQGEELGSGEAQGEALRPGEAQGEELGSGDAQDEAPGPGEELGLGETQGEELDPG